MTDTNKPVFLPLPQVDERPPSLHDMGVIMGMPSRLAPHMSPAMAALVEMLLEARVASALRPVPKTEAEQLAAIAADEEANRRGLEAYGLDPSRATELAKAQRAALKGEA